MTAVETHGLTKYYGARRGVKDVTMRVDEGDVYGFIGPNGAGKSTTIRLLLGLMSPDSGTAKVLGRQIGGNMNEILKNVGYMPSDAGFYQGMRVSDMLKLSARLRKSDCLKEGLRLCERLKLPPERKIAELSFGNKKKLGIVCAMQHKPLLYVLDEPTSGLDPLIQREFFALLDERRADGATVFLSSHVLSEIQRHCDRAAVIKDGTIIRECRVEELSDKSARRVILRGTNELPRLDGVKDVIKDSDSVAFLYSGDINALMRALTAHKLADVTISEPDIEETFIHFYEEADRA